MLHKTSKWNIIIETTCDNSILIRIRTKKWSKNTVTFICGFNCTGVYNCAGLAGLYIVCTRFAVENAKANFELQKLKTYSCYIFGWICRNRRLVEIILSILFCCEASVSATCKAYGNKGEQSIYLKQIGFYWYINNKPHWLVNKRR